MALVITVILMLILAGIGTNLIISDRNIFQMAVTSGEKYNISEYIDKVELARGDVQVANGGIATLKNLIAQIYADNVVPYGNIKEISDEQAKMVTVEGWVFIITADGVKYVGNSDELQTPPELKEGDIEFIQTPIDWTNMNVDVKIKLNIEGTYIIQYSFDGDKWKDYEGNIELKENGTIYSRIRNNIGEVSEGSYASYKVTNIDKLDPVSFKPIITTTTNSITINASEAKDADATEVYGKSGIKAIYYSNDDGDTWSTNNQDVKNTIYTFTKLTQATAYKVKVKVIDNAGNQKIISLENDVITSTVTTAEGNINISAPTWDANTHKASVTITKNADISSELKIQYQVNDVKEDEWVEGINVKDLSLNDTVYARLWDGTNAGSYTSLKITDKIPPHVALSINKTTTNSIGVEVKASDAESGLPENVIYTFYIKQSKESDEKYVEKQKGTSTVCNFEGLSQNTSYTIKVTVKDNADNEGSDIKEKTTGTVAKAEGNITFTNEPSGWTNTDVKVTGSTKSGYIIQLSKTSDFPDNTNEVKEVIISENQTIYARLIDNSMQYNGAASYKITTIDREKPVIQEVTESSNGIAVKALDGLSGINGYRVTTTKEKPELASFTGCSNTKNLNIVIPMTLQETTYYVWVRDEAGNVSEAKDITLGHKYSETFTIDKAATCIDTGIKSQHCTRCDSKINETVIPLSGHSYAYYSSSSATCTSSGSTTYKCTVCGSTYTSYSSSLGHNYSAATCTSSSTCTRCGAYGSGPLGHNYGPYTTTTAATCTKEGVQTSTCSRCGATKTQTLAVPGHNYSAYKVTTAATCTKDGVKTSTCSRCGATKTQTIDKTGHSYGSYKTTTAATCTKDGVKTSTCANCGATKTQTIDKTGHSYSSATCTSAKKCSKCGATSGSALGHNYSAATCTSPKKCSRCGATSGSKLSHSYSAATCTSAKKCTKCGATSGTPLGHSWRDVGGVDYSAYCTRCGAKRGK